MKKVSISDIKVHIAEYLRTLRPDEVLQICKRNVPVAEMRIIIAPKKKTKGLAKWGTHRNEILIHEDAFEPLSEQDIGMFDGNDL